MVRVSVEPAHAEVGLGSAVAIEVRVFNASDIVDHFAVSALGVDPSWVSVDVDRAQLEPGGEATIRVSIALPESARLAAGEHVVGIRVASLSDPGQSAVEEVRLDVGAATDVTVQLEPSQLRAASSGRANVRVENRGNRSVWVDLAATDPELAMKFSFAPNRIEVPAFTRRDSVLGVRLPRRWFGRPLTRTFTVEGRYDEGSTAAAGTVVQRAFFAPWLVRALTTALGLGLIAAVALMLTRDGGGDSSVAADTSTTVVTTLAPTSTTVGDDTTPDEPTTTTSSGAQTVQVANLLGLTPVEAEAWATGQGVELSVSPTAVDVASDSGLVGRVAAQSIAAGAEVAPGTSVSVSLGAVRVLSVPDVVGLGEADAIQALANAGFTGQVDGTVEVGLLSDLRGVIAEQLPVGGAELEQGATVSLFVGQIERIIVPVLPALASYPFTGDGMDTTGNNGEATLLNVTFAEGGLYCHGTHHNMDPSGCEILTPLIGGFDFTRFSVHIEFRPTLSQTGPVVVGGTSHRWLGFLLNEDGTTTLLYNNSGREQCNTGITYAPNQWHSAVLTYDGATAQMFLDGALVCQLGVVLEHSNDANLGTGNYSSGRVFEGWVRGLRVYSDVVPPAAG